LGDQFDGDIGVSNFHTTFYSPGIDILVKYISLPSIELRDMNTHELQTVAIIAKPAGFTINANNSAIVNLGFDWNC